jgi:hypothetical protein
MNGTLRVGRKCPSPYGLLGLMRDGSGRRDRTEVVLLAFRRLPYFRFSPLLCSSRPRSSRAVKGRCGRGNEVEMRMRRGAESRVLTAERACRKGGNGC